MAAVEKIVSVVAVAAALVGPLVGAYYLVDPAGRLRTPPPMEKSPAPEIKVVPWDFTEPDTATTLYVKESPPHPVAICAATPGPTYYAHRMVSIPERYFMLRRADALPEYEREVLLGVLNLAQSEFEREVASRYGSVAAYERRLRSETEAAVREWLAKQAATAQRRTYTTHNWYDFEAVSFHAGSPMPIGTDQDSLRAGWRAQAGGGAAAAGGGGASGLPTGAGPGPGMMGPGGMGSGMMGPGGMGSGMMGSMGGGPGMGGGRGSMAPGMGAGGGRGGGGGGGAAGAAAANL